MKIFEFWKKFLKAYGDAFYDVQLLGVFYKNLYLLTYEEMLMKKSKKHYDFKSSTEKFVFKLLSFCNEWSYWYQIGLKLKLICSSFKKSKEGNFSLMGYYIGHEKLVPWWKFGSKVDSQLTNRFKTSIEHFISSIPKNYFKIAFIWDQSGIYSSIRLEMRAI